MFRNIEKLIPALRSYEKDKSLYGFRDRMRGYLGLPRRRASVAKKSKFPYFVPPILSQHLSTVFWIINIYMKYINLLKWFFYIFYNNYHLIKIKFLGS